MYLEKNDWLSQPNSFENKRCECCRLLWILLFGNPSGMGLNCSLISLAVIPPWWVVAYPIGKSKFLLLRVCFITGVYFPKQLNNTVLTNNVYKCILPQKNEPSREFHRIQTIQTIPSCMEGWHGRCRCGHHLVEFIEGHLWVESMPWI